MTDHTTRGAEGECFRTRALSMYMYHDEQQAFDVADGVSVSLRPGRYTLHPFDA